MMTAIEMINLLDGALGYDRGPEHVRDEDALVVAINALFARLEAAEAALVAADEIRLLVDYTPGPSAATRRAYDTARAATRAT